MIFTREDGLCLIKVVLILVLIPLCNLYGQFAGGNGTENDPWQIARPGDLDLIRNYLGAEHDNKYYIQTHDIDLDVAPWNQEEGWVPIAPGGDNKFYGHYDGNGFEIRNLTIDRAASAQSLFGVTNGATLENIRLTNINILAPGWGNIAGLVGLAEAGTVISNCSVTGSVTGATTGNNGWQVGGLVGNLVNSSVTDSYADVRVIGRTRCGGLVGWVNASRVSNSFSKGPVNNADGVAGGLVGLLMRWGDGQGEGSITNSYATGAVTVGGNQGGGLIGTIGAGTVSYCYATGEVTGTGGGLVGQSNTQNTVTDSYWDRETTGKNESFGGGEGRLTRQMIYPYDINEAFVRWDFEEIWRYDSTFVIDENPGVNNGYPYLYYQYEPPAEIAVPVVWIEIIEVEGQNTVRIWWEAVEGAVSYKVFQSDDPYLDADEWGEPIAHIEETEYRRVAGEGKYFFVKASIEEAD